MASPEGKLRLTNTLTGTKEDFVPLDPANVRMYVCGPTVYDFAHIGNARPAIVFDVLFRLLRHLYPGEGTASDGSRVTYVRNITDVDDKINARAARDFPGLPLNEAIRRVTETTASQYQKDVTALGCLPPTVQPRATENIAEMQAIIGRLLASRHAYEAAGIGEVLFDVGSMPDYGALSGRDLQNNLAGARVEIDTHKKNPADFVLWKRSSSEEPGWDSPWGRGRPGWHIECSAMSERYLGQTFDIHGGGLDLIFPHHENELAQSRCAHGTELMARYWMHNGFLQVEGKKMSKSEGNFITINDVLRTRLALPFFDLTDGVDEGAIVRSWNGVAGRLVMLMTHYRAPIDWTARRFEEARAEVIAWHEMLKDIAFDGIIHEPESVERYVELLSDDLNTPAAITALRDAYTSHKHRELGVGLVLLGFYDRELARRYDLTIEHIRRLERDRVQSAIKERLSALNSRDFKRADEIRAALLAEGIQLMDGKDSAGNRSTTWELKR